MFRSAAVCLLASVAIYFLFSSTALFKGVCSTWNATAAERAEVRRLQQLPCGHCINVSHAPSISSISCEQFTELYAKTGRPLILKDALSSSSLINVSLSDALSYFQKVYQTSDQSGKTDDYFNEFRNVMDGYKAAAVYKPEDIFESANVETLLSTAWYLNWRLFNEEFLENKESLVPTPYCFSSWSYPHLDNIEFFFANPKDNDVMTSFGRHVDNTESSGTWHAQLVGTKIWQVWPPLECEEVCEPMNITVKAGDSLFINTDIWEHRCVIPPRSEENPYSLSIAQDYMLSIWDNYLLTFDFYRHFYRPHKYTFQSMTHTGDGEY